MVVKDFTLKSLGFRWLIICRESRPLESINRRPKKVLSLFVEDLTPEPLVNAN